MNIKFKGNVFQLPQNLLPVLILVVMLAAGIWVLSVSPAQQIVSPAQQIVSPAQQIVSPAQQIVSPVQQIVSPAQQIKAFIPDLLTF